VLLIQIDMDINVMCLFFQPILPEIIFGKTANTKSYRSSSKPSCSVRTDGRTDKQIW